MELQDFKAGDRIQLHPATDAWMRGQRYASVHKVGRRYLDVRTDSGSRLKVSARNALEIVGREGQPGAYCPLAREGSA